MQRELKDFVDQCLKALDQKSRRGVKNEYGDRKFIMFNSAADKLEVYDCRICL
jgi:hypothetical protein